MTTTSKRLASIDALRGFDMLLIAGGGAFIYRFLEGSGWAWTDTVVRQMEHTTWHGFTFWDFIMPLFLFISGTSLVFSINKALEMGMTKSEIYKKVIKRTLILIVLGIIYKNSPLNIWDPAHIRYSSVLGRIGIALLATSLLYLNFSWQKRLLWVAGILITYYAALFLIPVPGYGAGDLSFEGNLVGWFDRTFMPGRLLQGTYDELAILTQFPALCITVLGAWAGDILRNTAIKQMIKIKWMVLIGFSLIGLGLLWGLHFPINKRLWSSSFILLTSGMGFLFLSIFYWLIDIKGYKKWAFFFIVIGMNSLAVYYAYRFINFYYSSKLLFSGFYGVLPEKWHPALEALGALALVWSLMYFFYKKKVFFKV
jgi:predicted acyltransferase